MTRILFVCLGNICRSPTAEGVMRALVEREGVAAQFTLDSAGTGAWHIGELPDLGAREAAARRAIQLAHRARQFTHADFGRFDLVLAMDHSNLRTLQTLAGRATTDLRLFRSFDPTAPPLAELSALLAGPMTAALGVGLPVEDLEFVARCVRVWRLARPVSSRRRFG